MNRWFLRTLFVVCTIVYAMPALAAKSAVMDSYGRINHFECERWVKSWHRAKTKFILYTKELDGSDLKYGFESTPVHILTINEKSLLVDLWESAIRKSVYLYSVAVQEAPWSQKEYDSLASKFMGGLIWSIRFGRLNPASLHAYVPPNPDFSYGPATTMRLLLDQEVHKLARNKLVADDRRESIKRRIQLSVCEVVEAYYRYEILTARAKELPTVSANDDAKVAEANLTELVGPAAMGKLKSELASQGP